MVSDFPENVTAVAVSGAVNASGAVKLTTIPLVTAKRSIKRRRRRLTTDRPAPSFARVFVHRHEGAAARVAAAMRGPDGSL